MCREANERQEVEEPSEKWLFDSVFKGKEEGRGAGTEPENTAMRWPCDMTSLLQVLFYPQMCFSVHTLKLALFFVKLCTLAASKIIVHGNSAKSVVSWLHHNCSPRHH